jgi:RNA polymerase sigma factor (TIGR02999 family)
MDAAELPDSITRLVGLWSDGDRSAFEKLIPLAYQEMKRLAVIHAGRGRSGDTLQPTALVHEVYLRLALQPAEVRDRVHFLSLVSRMMRHILVDHAREKKAQKRGGLRVTLAESSAVQTPETAFDMLVVDAVLDRLEAQQPDLVRIVEMRFFGGMTAEEISAEMQRTVPSVNHSLRMAKMWLRRELVTGDSL